MRLSTICYIVRDGQCLMLHRVKKNKDVNAGKWIGVGGGLEAGESPDECVFREVLEETGLTLTQTRMRGVITFQSQGWEDEIIFVYTGGAAGDIRPDCDEGELRWVPISAIENLNLWAGDVIFLRLLFTTDEFFSIKMSYEGDRLVHCALNGRDITNDTTGERLCP